MPGRQGLNTVYVREDGRMTWLIFLRMTKIYNLPIPFKNKISLSMKSLIITQKSYQQQKMAAIWELIAIFVALYVFL
jgi:hypothetical protein